MRAVVLAVLGVSVLAFPAPGAHAGSDSAYLGGCDFASASDPAAEGQQSGEIDVAALVYSPAAAHNPVWATFTCYIRVNGVAQPGATVTASGAVAVVGGGLITYPAADSDHVQLCQRVDYTGPGDTTPTSDACFDPPYIQIPPDVVCEGGSCVDLATCAVTAVLPDVPGVVDTNDQGDVYLAGDPFWDCPPYDIDWD